MDLVNRIDICIEYENKDDFSLCLLLISLPAINMNHMESDPCQIVYRQMNSHTTFFIANALNRLVRGHYAYHC